MKNKSDQRRLAKPISLSGSPSVGKQLTRLADATGEFMVYWGFKKLHGQAWALIYLSPSPLSATEIISKLKVSKSLMSIALKELSEYGLIRTVSDPKLKVKRYSALPDVMSVIRDVLKTRELHLLRSAQHEYQLLEDVLSSHAVTADVDPNRLKSVGGMIAGASFYLKSMLGSESLENLSDLGRAEL